MEKREPQEEAVAGGGQAEPWAGPKVVDHPAMYETMDVEEIWLYETSYEAETNKENVVIEHQQQAHHHEAHHLTSAKASLGPLPATPDSSTGR